MPNVKTNAQLAAAAAAKTAREEDILLWGSIVAIIVYPLVLWWQRKSTNPYVALAVSFVGVLFSFTLVGFFRVWYDSYRAGQQQQQAQLDAEQPQSTAS